MRRVLLDALRRQRWNVATLLVILTAGWVLALRPGVSPAFVRGAYAVSFYIDLFLSIQLSAGPDSPRSLRLVHTLPIPRHDLATGAWLLAVIAPALVTMIAKALAVSIVLALSIATPVDLRWVAFSGVLDLAYVGSMCWLQPQLVRAGLAVGIGLLVTRVYWALGAILCVYVGGAPALAAYMPTGWNQWRWHTGLVLAGLLGMTVASRFQAARSAEFRPDLPPRTPPAPSPSERAVTPVTRVPFAGRLSVLRRMLWLQSRSAAITSAITVSLLVVAASLPWSPTPSRLEQIQQAVSAMPTEGGAYFWMLGWMLTLTIGMARWAPAKLALLRFLPISSREINLVLLTRTVVTCVAFWLALLPIYTLSPAAAHPWMGLGWLAALIGVVGLTNAAMWQWQRSQFTFLAPVAIVNVLIFAHPWRYVTSTALAGGTGQMAWLAVGICGFVATIRWNQRLISAKGQGRS